MKGHHSNRASRRLVRLAVFWIVTTLISVPAVAYASVFVEDLTSGNASIFGLTAVSGGGFGVRTTDTQPTGTGYIDPFLRIQQTGQERGFNTDDQKPPLDAKSGPWTHSIQMGALPIVTIGGVDYRELLLDVNQLNATPYLSLNQLQIFSSANALGGADYSILEASGTLNAVISFAGATQLFQMSGRDPSSVDAYEIQIDATKGSGNGNIYFDIVESAFAGTSSTDYITLFSQFGLPTGAYFSNDGFEEWAIQDATGGPVPEPASIVAWVLLAGAAGLAATRRCRKIAG